VHESAGAPLSEKEKIEKLISVVANMEGVQFIRKGVAYNCDVAAQFMRGKWSWKSSEVKTARDFVRICSAGNSGEGPPYFIRYADGTQVPTKVFLTEQLDKLEASASAQSSQ